MIQPEPGSAEERELVESGKIELLGRMPWSSNATFLVKLERAGTESLAIYKPRKGERPLWDSPGGRCASGKWPPTSCRRRSAGQSSR